ncbi:uncharacterized protein PFL1_02505 [Pseudozyma flocculosa PF-1]|uniref:C2H2-type domain-containing protein n=1 Tax=Pseudozyma flocculosa PF-1 TaxID=1277687 RepID=A0A061HA89_9BASI|nr:uncharacterized protein PFL1_02505 [Pseudozyma flocculosa PF-1]EPQ29832.1 hypothetical protein PFL1_02505 [Pseudozyma flocculosa PF-1]
MLDPQTVQAQFEALIKSQLGPSAQGASLSEIAAAAAAMLSPNADPSSRTTGEVFASDAASAGGKALDPDAPAPQHDAQDGPAQDSLISADKAVQPPPVAEPDVHPASRGTKRPRLDDDAESKSQRLQLDEDATTRLLRELEAVANGFTASAPAAGSPVPALASEPAATGSTLAPTSQHPQVDAVVAADGTSTTASAPAAATGSPSVPQSFQNTFAQYQYPQDHHLAFRGVVRASSAEERRHPSSSHGSGTPTDAADGHGGSSTGMTREEEERAADALIQDIDAVEAATSAPVSGEAESASATAPAPAPGDTDAPPVSAGEEPQKEVVASAAESTSISEELAVLTRVAAAFIGDGNPLNGDEESQRALAEAVKRLSAQHEQVVQQAAEAAAAAASRAAAAAEASKSNGTRAGATSAATPSIATNGASPNAGESGRSPSARGSGKVPVKRFQCPKCERAFARAFNLNTHLATHDPDPNRSKPYPCPYPSCRSEGGRSFSRKHDLQRHVASVHEFEPEPGIKGDPGEIRGDTGGLASLGLGTPGKKFRCEACGRSFVRRDACNRHQCAERQGSREADGSAGPEGSASPAPRSSSVPGPGSTPASAPPSVSASMPAPGPAPGGSSVTPAAPSSTSRAQPRQSPKSATTLLGGNLVSLYHSGPARDSATRSTQAASKPPSSAASSAAQRQQPGGATGSTRPAPHAAVTGAHAAYSVRTMPAPRPILPKEPSQPSPHAASAAAIAPGKPAEAASATVPSVPRRPSPAPLAAPSSEAVPAPDPGATAPPRDAQTDDESDLDQGFSQEVQDIGRRLLAQARAQDRRQSSHQKQASLTQRPMENQQQSQQSQQSQPLAASTSPVTSVQSQAPPPPQQQPGQAQAQVATLPQAENQRPAEVPAQPQSQPRDAAETRPILQPQPQPQPVQLPPAPSTQPQSRPEPVVQPQGQQSDTARPIATDGVGVGVGGSDAPAPPATQAAPPTTTSVAASADSAPALSVGSANREPATSQVSLSPPVMQVQQAQQPILPPSPPPPPQQQQQQPAPPPTSTETSASAIDASGGSSLVPQNTLKLGTA